MENVHGENAYAVPRPVPPLPWYMCADHAGKMFGTAARLINCGLLRVGPRSMCRLWILISDALRLSLPPRTPICEFFTCPVIRMRNCEKKIFQVNLINAVIIDNFRVRFLRIGACMMIFHIILLIMIFSRGYIFRWIWLMRLLWMIF